MEKIKNSELMMRNHYEWCKKEGRKTYWYAEIQKKIEEQETKYFNNNEKFNFQVVADSNKD